MPPYVVAAVLVVGECCHYHAVFLYINPVVPSLAGREILLAPTPATQRGHVRHVRTYLRPSRSPFFLLHAHSRVAILGSLLISFAWTPSPFSTALFTSYHDFLRTHSLGCASSQTEHSSQACRLTLALLQSSIVYRTCRYRSLLGSHCTQYTRIICRSCWSFRVTVSFNTAVDRQCVTDRVTFPSLA